MSTIKYNDYQKIGTQNILTRFINNTLISWDYVGFIENTSSREKKLLTMTWDLKKTIACRENRFWRKTKSSIDLEHT